MRPADRAWLTAGAVVAGWDLIGPETLSGAVDRYHHRWPWLTRMVILYLAAHLLGVVPARGDPLSYLTYWKRPRN